MKTQTPMNISLMSLASLRELTACCAACLTACGHNSWASVAAGSLSTRDAFVLQRWQHWQTTCCDVSCSTQPRILLAG